MTATTPLQAKAPRAVGDFRRILDDKNVDAISIAAPDHWHAPATILALDAGKHVYVEKPSGHDPREDELIVAAARKHPQPTRAARHPGSLGSALHRSAAAASAEAGSARPTSRAPGTRTRAASIGKGKPAPVPANLDYELWQGPAPRTPYRDNVIHYNWHWFTRLGHRRDLQQRHARDRRRALAPRRRLSHERRRRRADASTSPTTGSFPTRRKRPSSSTAARASSGRARAATDSSSSIARAARSILGTNGSVVVDRDGYVVYDLKNKVVKAVKAAPKGDALNTVGDDLADAAAHRTTSSTRFARAQSSPRPIEDGAKTGTLCHLGTIAQQVGRKLTTDPKNGHIIGDENAAKLLVARVRPAVEAGGVTELHEDRYFDPDPIVRRYARALYDETRALPIVSPHGHVDPAILADDEPFKDPTSLLITPDHYVLRMLYSRGVPLESLGVPPIDGRHRTRSRTRAGSGSHSPTTTISFAARPRARGSTTSCTSCSAFEQSSIRRRRRLVYDEIAEQLQSPEFRPRALFERFNIEVLATTDAATDTLEHHTTLRESELGGRVIPTFRPDALFRIAAPGWRDELGALRARQRRRDRQIRRSFLRRARENGARYFKALGATATDHAVVEPLHGAARPRRGGAPVPARAARRTRRSDDQARFEAHMLMEMARMSVEDGLVMQLHPGALRDHNARRVRALRRRQGRRHPGRDRVHAQPARAAQRVRQRSALHARAVHARRVDLRARARAARRTLSGGAARPAVVVPRFHRGHDALSPADDRDGGHLQHRRLQRRHARVLLDPRAPRPRAARRRELPRRPGRAPRHRYRRCERDGERDGVRSCEARL